MGQGLAAAGLGVCLLLGTAEGVQAAAPLSAQDRAALSTRTPVPQPSAALIEALALAVPDWHRPGVEAPKVAIGADAIRASSEAALAALRALPPSSAFNDFDRAWIAFETASALRALGRDDEARKAYEAVREMRRTKVQDRYTLMALHDLGDQNRPGRCPAGDWQQSSGASALEYPPPALIRGIEGWVDVIADVREDGSVAYLTTISSSLALFEPAVTRWLSGLRFRTAEGRDPGRPCFARQKVGFKLSKASDVQFPIDMVVADDNFSFRSIGAARAVRGAARAAALGDPTAAPAAGAPAR